MKFKIYRRFTGETYEKTLEAEFDVMFDVVDFISSTYKLDESIALDVYMHTIGAVEEFSYVCNGAALHKDRA